jgi:hypothetical protein
LQSTAVDNGGNLRHAGREKKKLMPEIFWMHSWAQKCTAIEQVTVEEKKQNGDAL